MENPSLAPVIALQKLHSELVEKLSAHPDFIALKAVEAALAKLTQGTNALLPQGTVVHGYTLSLTPNRAGEQLTLGDLAYHSLRAAGGAMQLSTLADRLENSGHKINLESLSSLLSRDNRFKSLSRRNRRFWALTEWPDDVRVHNDWQQLNPGWHGKGGDDA